jgi:lysophospholipase L1-like esterase
MAKKVFIIYLLLIHAFVALVLVKSDFIGRVQTKFGLINLIPNLAGIYHETDLKPEVAERYREVIAYQIMMDSNIPDNAIIFMGDSLTQSLPVSAITPLGVNFGIGNDTSLGVIQRLKHYSSIRRAKIVIIEIGLYDLSIIDPNEVLKNYENIINSIPPNTEIVFSAVHPVNENFCKQKGRSNERIDQLNSGLKQLCAKYSNVHFVSIAKLLKDETGNLANEYHIGDGVHLNYYGYKIWIKELKMKIEELSGKKY